MRGINRDLVLQLKMRLLEIQTAECSKTEKKKSSPQLNRSRSSFEGLRPIQLGNLAAGSNFPDELQNGVELRTFAYSVKPLVFWIEGWNRYI